VKRVGYLINTEAGPVGEGGIYYDYILAGNGVFIRAENHLIKATVNIVEASVRGIPPLQQSMKLSHGRIPRRIYDLALSTLMADPYREQLAIIAWDEGYRLKVPQQEVGECRIRYQTLSNTVLEFHSHGLMEVFFSTTDDRDEQGLCLYAVAGRLDRLIPDVSMRLGVYGYFAPVRFSEVFDDGVHTG
jgi:PRTRC genetic system protein A